MPRTADSVVLNPHLRILVMGAPKVGKTRCVLETCPKPAYVINTEDEASLAPAARVTSSFEWDLVTTNNANVFQEMETALATARKGVKEGKYKTIVWDTLTSYARRIEPILEASTDTGRGPDGRRFWPLYEKRLLNVADRLLELKAHVIVISHYYDVGGEISDNQIAKKGSGIVPAIAGKARMTLPGLFQDVVFLEKRPSGKRVFITSADGVWGPGARSLEGVSEIPASIAEFIKLRDKQAQQQKGK